MIFFGTYPHDEDSKKGGLSQRILAIDSQFLDRKRCYLSVSYRKNIRSKVVEVNNNLKTYELNAFIHFYLILKIILSANIIYMHTIGNALKYLPYSYFIKSDRVFLDLHGVVPEECKMFGRPLKSRLFNIVEYLILKRKPIIICVSKAMLLHFEGKYKSINFRSVILPIFSSVDFSQVGDKGAANAKLKVIYAGGTQVWQNVTRMLELSLSCSEFHFEYWLPNKDKEHYVHDENLSSVSNITFNSGTNLDVLNAYKTSDLGFVLRDDNVVNNVACPTKIVEYMENGVVPIIKTDKVGDFKYLGLKSFTIEDLISNNITHSLVEFYLNENKIVLKKFRKLIVNGLEELKILTENKGQN